MNAIHDLQKGCVARVYLQDGGHTWVYVRKVGRTQITFVRLEWGAQSTKMSVDDFDDRVDDRSIHPATNNELERFQRLTSAWRL